MCSCAGNTHAAQQTATVHRIGGHNPSGSEPPVSGKAGRNPQDVTPVELKHITQCTMSFSVTRNGVLKAKFHGGSEPGGYVRGVYGRQS